MPGSKQQPDYMPDEINLLDYLQVIVKRRKMIARNVLYAALAMAVISFVLPSTYTAKTTLLPPDDGQPQGLRGLLANAPISFLNLPGMPSSSSEIFVEILKSRSVGYGVLKHTYTYDGKEQDLYTIWDEDSPEEAFKKLQNSTTISANEQGVVAVAVEVRDPELAAQIANTYVRELDRINQEKSFSKAKNSRRYIEEQLKLTEANLKRASQELAAFQSKFKAVDLEEQTKVAIEKAGEIKGTVMAREVELQVALQTMKKNNPVILRLQKELDELRKQLEHLQFGNSVSLEDQKDYFIPFADVPEVGLKYAELLREVKVQETVWQLLNQQYYSAKIEEARDTPTVQVLDEAIPPELRTSPKRKLLILVSAFLALMFSVFGAFVMEYTEKVKQDGEENEKLTHIASELSADVASAKNRLQSLVRWFRR